jgi:hypothetical protein
MSTNYTPITSDQRPANAATFNAPLDQLDQAIINLSARADVAHDASGALIANTVGSTQLQDGAVTGGKLAPDAVSHSNMAPNSIGDDEIIDGNVEDKHLATDIKIGGLSTLPVGVPDKSSVVAVLGNLYNELSGARNGYTTLDSYLDSLVLAGI